MQKETITFNQVEVTPQITVHPPTMNKKNIIKWNFKKAVTFEIWKQNEKLTTDVNDNKQKYNRHQANFGRISYLLTTECECSTSLKNYQIFFDFFFLSVFHRYFKTYLI